MRTSFFSLLAVITLSLSSFTSNAALMRFSFTGVITDVTNEQQPYWNAEALSGSTVEGEFLMDTSSPIGGRLETSWFWWWVNDNEPPVLTSQISFGNDTYRLNNEGTYIPEFDMYVPDEYIAMTNGPDYDGGPVGDGQHLTDYVRFNETTESGELSSFMRLDYFFTDYTRDFLTFPEQNMIPIEVPPDFEQSFTWQDNDLNDDSAQVGAGSLRFYQSLYSPDTGRSTLFDSTVRFDLVSVQASQVAVPVPPTLILFALGASMLYTRRRRVTA